MENIKKIEESPLNSEISELQEIDKDGELDEFVRMFSEDVFSLLESTDFTDFIKLIAYHGFEPLPLAEKINQKNSVDDIRKMLTLFVLHGPSIRSILDACHPQEKKFAVQFIKKNGLVSKVGDRNKHDTVTLRRIAAAFPTVMLEVLDQHGSNGSISLENFLNTGKNLPAILTAPYVLSILERSKITTEQAKTLTWIVGFCDASDTMAFNPDRYRDTTIVDVFNRVTKQFLGIALKSPAVKDEDKVIALRRLDKVFKIKEDGSVGLTEDLDVILEAVIKMLPDCTVDDLIKPLNFAPA